MKDERNSSLSVFHFISYVCFFFSFSGFNLHYLVVVLDELMIKTHYFDTLWLIFSYSSNNSSSSYSSGTYTGMNELCNMYNKCHIDGYHITIFKLYESWGGGELGYLSIKRNGVLVITCKWRKIKQNMNITNCWMIKKCIALYKKRKEKYLTNKKVAKNHNGTIRFGVKLSQKRLVR